MRYYLGIDGGGTVSKAAVADSQGNIVCRVSGDTINFYAVGMSCAKENLSEIIKRINIAMGEEVKYSSVCIGNSALDSQADSELTNEFINGVIECENAVMHSDLYVALSAAEEKGNVCLAICGTGSMAIGRCTDGTVVTKGGWGHIIGDEGSAYSISINALKYACILYDCGKSTLIFDGAKEYFGVTDFKQIIDKIYTDAPKSYIAGFAKVVGDLACEDFVAKSVIVNEAQGFSKTVISLIKSVKDVSCLKLYGGVFKNNELFTNTFMQDIHELYPELNIGFLEIPPEEGALKVAMNER